MLASAREVYRQAFSRGLMPDPDYNVSEWAAERRVLPAETTSFPGKWRNERTPFLIEVMDCLSPQHPCDRVTLMKSAQVSGSEGITNFIGYIIDVAPGPAMVIHPTMDAGKAWSREKLTPNIEENDWGRKVAENKSRDGASTSMFKKFPGGFLVITGANSAAALRQKSIRYLFKDDWDEWPLDVGGQGDPDKMANARQIAFHDSGTAKSFEVSTPTLKSISRITRSYEQSDQRVFEVPCPHCGEEQELRFFPAAQEPFKGGLKFNKKPPHMAYYVCEHNGCIIEHHEKRKMLAAGRWLARNPEGTHPGFYINALYSPFTTWDKMVEAFLAAKDNPRELKTFFNLWLGLAWEERGDAPDWKRLLTLREDYPLGFVPQGALIITVGIDVQKDGFYYEVVGWGIGKTSWVIDIGFLSGDTGHPATWKQLDDLYHRYYENAWSRSFQADMLAIDSGYMTHLVYQWVRGKPRAFAVKGVAGAQAPVLGTASKIDVTFTGKRKKRGSMRIWPVGGWQAKSEFYAYLRLEGTAEGAEMNPHGYCHFSTGCDENYFKQLTSESLVTHQRNGREITEWMVSGENHFLDCRIYNMAAAERCEISRFTVEKWRALATLREVPPETLQGDLLALENQLNQVPKPSVQPAEPKEMPQAGEENPKPRPPARRSRRRIRVKH
jgi:phage terminase large subunit GpA-like protein